MKIEPGVVLITATQAAICSRSLRAQESQICQVPYHRDRSFEQARRSLAPK